MTHDPSAAVPGDQGDAVAPEAVDVVPIDPRTGPRRELRLAVLLCLLGAGVLLLATSRVWVSFSDDQQLTTSAVRTGVHGTLIAPGARALGLVALAGVLALAATRRLGRLLVGALLLAAGLGAVVVVARALGDDLVHRGVRAQSERDQLSGLQLLTGLQAHRTWPVLAVAGAVLVALSGLLVTVRGRRWATLSDSYRPPAARPAPSAPVGEKAVWDALDRGDDPTT